MSQFGGKDSKRHFTVVMGNKEHGLYISSTPSSAAKKAVTKLCTANKSKKVDFSIREITQGSKKKTYGPYIGYIEKLKEPIELKGRVIRYKPVAKLSGKSSVKKGGMIGGAPKAPKAPKAPNNRSLYNVSSNNNNNGNPAGGPAPGGIYNYAPNNFGHSAAGPEPNAPRFENINSFNNHVVFPAQSASSNIRSLTAPAVNNRRLIGKSAAGPAPVNHFASAHLENNNNNNNNNNSLWGKNEQIAFINLNTPDDRIENTDDYDEKIKQLKELDNDIFNIQINDQSRNNWHGTPEKTSIFITFNNLSIAKKKRNFKKNLDALIEILKFFKKQAADNAFNTEFMLFNPNEPNEEHFSPEHNEFLKILAYKIDPIAPTVNQNLRHVPAPPGSAPP